MADCWYKILYLPLGWTGRRIFLNSSRSEVQHPLKQPVIAGKMKFHTLSSHFVVLLWFPGDCSRLFSGHARCGRKQGLSHDVSRFIPYQTWRRSCKSSVLSYLHVIKRKISVLSEHFIDVYLNYVFWFVGWICQSGGTTLSSGTSQSKYNLYSEQNIYTRVFIF